MEDNERRFEQDIETWLTSYEGGWQREKFQGTNYDASKGLDLDKLIGYVQRTQAKKWQQYENIYPNPQEAFYKRFEETVKAHGMLYVLRNGFKDRGVAFKLVTFKPVSSLNEQIELDYRANEFTCVRQFAYSPNNHNTIDMVLMVNGLPLVALELKNQIKGQSVDNAKLQFMKDRDPRETVFKFNHRFLVYFAVDLYEAYMTTALKGFDTLYLPFNQGSNGAGNVGTSGNPPNPSGYTTDYLWKNVLQRDRLMDILNRYMNLEVKKEMVDGKEKIKKTLIFPRYHQLDVVTKLVADVVTYGSGKNYLIQHSAGSGKSNSIAWLAYHLSNIHDMDNNPRFTSVIIVTDRTVLDRQLQDTITSFEHKAGLVETINDKKSSKDLRDAINDGKRIIITTLQKFPVIYQEIDKSKKKNFAVIVDEAHSSQAGKASQKLKQALADKEEALKEWQAFDEAVENESPDSQDELVQTIIAQGKHSNLSFFAFTATPKEKTLEMFGEKQDDGSFRPFHVYSMRQAIDEGFILDVLQNYMTYHTAYRIAKEIPDDPKLPQSAAKRAIRRYESLHPYNLRQKTEVMVETFREKTAHSIGGRAKAMVVTPSRLHAVRYIKEFREYIKEKGYKDMDVLVAFSGEVVDEGEIYTEESMNRNKDGTKVKENQLKKTFHTPDFNVLIVAEKYQTGFDEPLLHTMFVDKKLRGVKAVQTLSRLNRTTSGKTDTCVLDFENTAEEIQKAFQPYYEGTMLDQEINVNMIYDAQSRIRKYNLYSDEDIQKVLSLYNKEKAKQDAQDLGKLASAYKPIIDRYSDIEESQQYEYRVLLRGFVKSYNYVTQLTALFDKELLEEVIFIEYLIRFLPKANVERVDLTDKVRMEYYKLHKDFEGQIALVAETLTMMNNQKEINATVKPPEEKDTLEAILDKLNSEFEGELSEGDKIVFNQIAEHVVNHPDERQINLAKNNSWDMFNNSLFPKEFLDETSVIYEQNASAFDKLFTNQDLFNQFQLLVSMEAYKAWRSKVPTI
ncbi:type I restriction endonuclease subunit R [Bacillus toyonensis]|uniref:type I restriction endonuclease subunit R n=1 Tax=Bacillus toyonensis TaxID=155322 RepID=UPI0021CF3FDE|nr:DEAD/DEAH box helicase family protein [Bacillus toyonensis]MCU5092050.1 type I restriction endonuclease [Bacillus toyonensis]